MIFQAVMTDGRDTGHDLLKTAFVLQVLAPLSWTFGLWLIFPVLQINGSACLSCFPGTGVYVSTSSTAIIQTIAGAFFFLFGFLLFAASLGLIASDTSQRAQRWLGLLGKLRPTGPNKQYHMTRPDKYRPYALATLLGLLVDAILLIPGIGEDRQFPLNQFFNLWGTVWYLYVLSIGISGLILIYCKKPGGFILSLITGAIGIAMSVPDLLGLLPPSPPTFKTSTIFLGGLVFAVPLVYLSSRAIQALTSKRN
jgi:hypothetical protein